MTEEKIEVDKGGRAEEALRQYFLDTGIYVVRGIGVTFRDYEVTDVDLWLYSKPSPFKRDRTNVDIKNKKTPQAMERIFWAKGLQVTLGLDSCMVATTDKQPHVKEFGQRYGVMILDGQFLGALSQKYASSHSRITDDELFFSKKDDSKKKSWIERAQRGKARLLTALDFNGCNAWLADCQYFIGQIFTSGQDRENACRFFYLTLSQLLIGLDYVLHQSAFAIPQERLSNFKEGLLYGELGKEGHERTLNTALQILKHFGSKSAINPNQVKEEFSRQLESSPFDMLVQYFLKPEIQKELFSMACSIEAAAYSKTFVQPQKLSSHIQGVISLVLDFYETERKKFFDLFIESISKQAEMQQLSLENVKS